MYNKYIKQELQEFIELAKYGDNRYIVHHPFMFDDGDHLGIVLKQDEEGEWLFSDEGHTYMHFEILARDPDDNVFPFSFLPTQFSETILKKYDIEDREGELIAYINNNTRTKGKEFQSALADLIHAILRMYFIIEFAEPYDN